MIKDLRYVIKKILIGIGIILGISLIRSCNVYAIDSNMYNTYFYDEKSFPLNQSSSCHSVGQTYKYVIKGHEYNIEYKAEGIYINNNLVSSDSNYFCNAWVLIKWANDGDDVSFMYFRPVTGNSVINTIYTPSILNYSNNFPYSSDSLYAGSNVVHVYRRRYNFQNGNYISKTENELTQCTSGCYDHDNRTDLYYNNVIYGYSFYVYGVNSTTHLGLFYNNNRKWITSDYSSSNYILKNPVINSLNPVLNKTDEGMLTSVSFTIDFSYIDNENYNYYAWFSGYQKMKITSNNVVLNTQNNTTLYVEITDKQGNNIDSETFNVSGIGLIYNGTYDIQFTTQEWTQSDSENDSDSIFDIIDRIDIDITYIPKWVDYKYEYQFVNVGDSLDSDSWVLVNDNSAKNNFVYTTHTNGTLYARILDSDNNELKSATYQVTRIGQIKIYDTNKNDVFFSFNKLKDMTNFGGPIGGLIVMPVNVLQAISDASNKVCTPYDFGSLLGHNIILPCIDIEHYIGSALWTTIDLIFSGCMFFAISKWFTSAYYNFIMLENTPGIKGRRDL